MARMPREVRMDAISSLDPYELSDRYDREVGRVFLTGTQAIVRIALDQVRLDRAAGLNTAGFISGHRRPPPRRVPPPTGGRPGAAETGPRGFPPHGEGR